MAAAVTTDSLLAQIVADLYRMAAGRPPVLPLPVPVIAGPAIATAILRSKAMFAKECHFLEIFPDLFQVDRLSGRLAFDYGLTSRPADRLEALVRPRKPLQK